MTQCLEQAKLLEKLGIAPKNDHQTLPNALCRVSGTVYTPS